MTQTQDLLTRMQDAVLCGDEASSAGLATEALESGLSPLVGHRAGLRAGDPPVPAISGRRGSTSCPSW